MFRFDPASPIAARQQDVTIITGDGPTLNLSLPASIELYTMLLALHCMEIGSLVGPVYTDYLKVVQVANNPTILAKMGRDSNLPL